MIYIYLSAIVASNFIVFYLGPKGLLITALILIPFDLVVRDYLHEKWTNNYLRLRMAALIGSGSLITFLLNYETINIALASLFAFGLAGLTDFIVFERLRHKSKFIRVNGSNVFSSFVDSVVFQYVAFNHVSQQITFEQTGLKILGGIIWGYIIFKLLFKDK